MQRSFTIRLVIAMFTFWYTIYMIENFIIFKMPNNTLYVCNSLNICVLRFLLLLGTSMFYPLAMVQLTYHHHPGRNQPCSKRVRWWTVRKRRSFACVVWAVSYTHLDVYKRQLLECIITYNKSLIDIIVDGFITCMIFCFICAFPMGLCNNVQHILMQHFATTNMTSVWYFLTIF